MSLRILYAFFLFFNLIQISTAQSLKGKIIDRETELPLALATIYFDGTTINTISDENGDFTISGSAAGNNDLVISFVGYTTYRLSKPSDYSGKVMKIYLDKNQTRLEEVVIRKGPFTRKQLLEVFRRQFLGQSEAGQSCKILNEDDIDISYDVSTNTLQASAGNTLKIKNEYLKYEVRFDLVGFELNYSATTLSHHAITRSYYAGSTFYIDLSKNGEADKKRLKTYLGSVSHLMHTVVNNDWEKQKFSMYAGQNRLNPSVFFELSDTLNMKKLKVIKVPRKAVTKADGQVEMEKVYFGIAYKNELNSVIDFTEPEILIDNDGNYSPISGILFGGYLGSLKAGDLLPRDYYQKIKDIVNK